MGLDTTVACCAKGDCEYRRLEGIFVDVLWVEFRCLICSPGSSTKIGNVGGPECQVAKAVVCCLIIKML